MTRSRRPSAQAAQVVLALAEQPAAWCHGNQLCNRLGLEPGSIYPILMDLADRGLLETGGTPRSMAGRRASSTG